MLTNYVGYQSLLINTLILVTKYYIYSSKCQRKQLNFNTLIARVEHYKKIEYIIALRKNKLVKHQLKWQK